MQFFCKNKLKLVLQNKFKPIVDDIVLLCCSKTIIMKKVLFTAISASFLFTACNNNAPAQMDDNMIMAKVDSIVAEKEMELKEEYKEDLEKRIAIEVKPLADKMIEEGTVK